MGKVYAADNPVRIGGLVFHPGHFTCKATGPSLPFAPARSGLTRKPARRTCTSRARFQSKPHQVVDVVTQRVGAVPDSNMRTTDRKFNIAGQAATRGAAGDEHHGSNYGAGAVAVETASSAPKPPTVVDNINKQEIRHNGTDQYTGAGDGEAAE